jgi:uncharacterized protein YfaS (alpha-2-macroglobulin family)
VRGDFVLSPDAPVTLAPGDEAEVGAGVSNNVTGMGDKPMPVAVTLKAGPQLQIIGPAVQTLPLAPMKEGAVTFRVRATQVLGSGALVFTASTGSKSATQRVDVSVRPAAAFRVQVAMKRVEPNSGAVVTGLRQMYGPYSARNAVISTVPAVLAQGLASWLVNYDNYCSEQIVSASMPRLVASKWLAVAAFQRALTPVVAGTTGPDALMKQIDALRSRQNTAGGFGVWSATPDSDPFVSAYAMHFLLEARDRGAPVPRDMIDLGNKYLGQLAGDDTLDSLDTLRQRAYAIYLLTRQGTVTTNNLAAAQKRLDDAFPNVWKNDLAAGWIAASYKLLKQDKQAGVLIAPLQQQLERTTAEPYAYGYYEDPPTRNATVLYLLAKHFPERLKALSPRVMETIVQPLENNQFNTLSAAMTMLALDVYGNSNAPAVEKLRIDELAQNGSGKPISTIQNRLLQAGSWSPAAKGLRFIDGSTLPAWYVVDQAGYDRDIPKGAIKNGLEIVREYTDAKGNPLAHITLGQEIDVHLKIRATGNKGVGDVAIVDLLPGGFEAVMQRPPAPVDSNANDGTAPPPETPAIRALGSTWDTVYADVREDRVVIYGTATPGVKEFVYRIKADAAGKFGVPPAYGESMYDRRIQARAPGGETLTVSRAP